MASRRSCLRLSIWWLLLPPLCHAASMQASWNTSKHSSAKAAGAQSLRQIAAALNDKGLSAPRAAASGPLCR
jgi:hypothetical protein